MLVLLAIAVTLLLGIASFLVVRHLILEGPTEQSSAIDPADHADHAGDPDAPGAPVTSALFIGAAPTGRQKAIEVQDATLAEPAVA